MNSTMVCLEVAWLVILASLGQSDGAGLSRIGVRDGSFVEQNTGITYVPLGANYYRTGTVSGGKMVHAAFCPGFYDRGYVTKMMAALADQGFNTIRTFHSYHVGPEGILKDPQSREITPEYLDNVVHFLREARRNRVHVIFSCVPHSGILIR